MCKSLFKPKMPAIPEAPPMPEPVAPAPTVATMDAGSTAPPSSETPAARQAADEQRRRAAAQRGRAATILTGPQGATGAASSYAPTASRMLLGG